MNEIGTNKPIKETRSLWAEIFEWVDCIVLTVLCLLLVFTFIFRQVEIEGGSMNETLLDGERIIVSNMFYTPKSGDIVVVSSEIYDDVPLIKRVIAVEGQWIDIKDGKVYVGNSRDTLELIEEPYVNGQITADIIAADTYGHHFYPLQVPKNKVFLLGDNREVSLDSRTQAVGMVDERHIIGKALYRVFPFEKMGSIY